MSARPRLRWLKAALAIAGLQAAFVALYVHVERERNEASAPAAVFEALPRVAAPDITLLAGDGSSTTLKHMRGKPVLLHFWATWCGPCKEELPALLVLGRELEQAGRAQLVALNVDRDWDAVRIFFNGAVPREVLRDGSGNATESFDVTALPDTYLLDADGSIAGRFGGPQDWRSESLRAEVLTELSR